MSKFFNNMILLGILTFSLGAFTAGFSQANGGLVELIGMGKSVRMIGFGIGIFGLGGKIVGILKK